MKILNAKVHGYFDFALMAALMFGPSFLGFTETAAASAAYGFALALLGVVLLTNYPFGIFKAIPFPVHGALEFIASFALALTPGFLGYGDAANIRNFFIALGSGLFLIWLLTDYRPESRREFYRTLRRDRDKEPVAHHR